MQEKASTAVEHKANCFSDQWAERQTSPFNGGQGRGKKIKLKKREGK